MAGTEGDNQNTGSDKVAPVEQSTTPGFDASNFQAAATDSSTQNSEQLDKHNFSPVDKLSAFAKTSMWNLGTDDGAAKEAGNLAKQMPFNQKSLIRSA